jgi:hypothetical protein
MILKFPSPTAIASFTAALAAAQPGSTVASIGPALAVLVECSDEDAARTLAATYGG